MALACHLLPVAMLAAQSRPRKDLPVPQWPASSATVRRSSVRPIRGSGSGRVARPERSSSRDASVRGCDHAQPHVDRGTACSPHQSAVSSVKSALDRELHPHQARAVTQLARPPLAVDQVERPAPAVAGSSVGNRQRRVHHALVDPVRVPAWASGQYGGPRLAPHTDHPAFGGVMPFCCAIQASTSDSA